MMNMRCNRYVTVKAPIWVNRTVGSKDASVSRVPREKSVYLFRQPGSTSSILLIENNLTKCVEVVENLARTKEVCH